MQGKSSNQYVDLYLPSFANPQSTFHLTLVVCIVCLYSLAVNDSDSQLIGHMKDRVLSSLRLKFFKRISLFYQLLDLFSVFELFGFLYNLKLLGYIEQSGSK